MQLGQTIQNIRKQNHLTQEQFAAIFSVTRQTVSNWENEKSYPDLLTLVQISDKFDISLDQMLKEDLKMTKKLNNEIKWAKHIKRILAVVIGAVVIAAVVWFFVWNHCKNEVEGKFYTGLDNYDYTIDEDVSQGGYFIITYDEDTYFAISHQKMPGYSSFRLDLMAKTIDCYTKLDGKKIKMTWTGYDDNQEMEIWASDEASSGAIDDGIKYFDEIRNDTKIKAIAAYGTKLYDALYK